MDELSALFAAADEEDFEDEDDIGVIAGSEVKRLKDESKAIAAQLKETTHNKLAKAAAGDLFTDLKAQDRLPAGLKKSDFIIGGTQTAPDYGKALLIADIASQTGADEVFTAPIGALAEDGPAMAERVTAIAARLEGHKALEDEAKALKADLRTAEKKQDLLVEASRAKITVPVVNLILLAVDRESDDAAARCQSCAD